MNEIIRGIIADFKRTNNHSLYQAIYNNNIDRMDNVAIEYRENKISYKKMFENIDLYACALAMMGYGRGSEIIAVISNTPEFIYMLLAASKIGAKFNPVGEKFLEHIIKKSDSRRIFLSDDNYEPLRWFLENCSQIDELVMFSLHDSLPWKKGEKRDPFKKIDDEFKSFDDKVLEYSGISSKKIIDRSVFLLEGEIACQDKFGFDPLRDRQELKSTFRADVAADDIFLISYVSDENDHSRPRATFYSNKSLMLRARLKESDVSSVAETSGVRVYAHMPSYDFENICTSIIESLYLGWTVIPEPIYDQKYFPYGVVMNQPNVCGAPVAFWRALCGNLEIGEYFKTLKLPYLYNPYVTREQMGPGEEAYFNRIAKKHTFGSERCMYPLNSVTFSSSGGINVIPGMFETASKELCGKKSIFKDNADGLMPLAGFEVDVVDEDGYSLRPGEYGEIIVQTECAMRGYYYDFELNKSAAIQRANRSIWYKTGTYGIRVEGSTRVQVKGRMEESVFIPGTDGNDVKYPLFLINDIVASDTKNILSSCVVKVQEGDATKIVIHFEPQREAMGKDESKLLLSIVERLDKGIPEVLKDSIYLRLRESNEAFPITPSGERDLVSLRCIEDDIAVPYREVAKQLAKKVKRIKHVPKAS